MSKKIHRIVTILAYMVVLSLLGGCSFVDDAKENALQQLEWTKENNAGGDNYNEELADQLIDFLSDEESPDSVYYNMGDTVSFSSENGGELDITLTDYGTEYDVFTNEKSLYVEYEITNTGKVPINVGNSMFHIYADNCSIAQSYVSDMAVMIETISSNRSIKGRIYGEVDIDSVNVIEIEVGNIIFIVKGSPDMEIDDDKSSIKGSPDIEIGDEKNAIDINDGFKTVNINDCVDNLLYISAEELSEVLQSQVTEIHYLEEYDCYGTADSALLLYNSDMGCEIYLKPSDQYTFSIFGINNNMSIEEANDILLNNGATDATLPDDTSAWRYIIDDIYCIVLFADGEGVDICFTPNYDYLVEHYDEFF